MSEIIAVVLAAALADNILFAKMLGLCPFINLSKRVETAAGIGAATFVVLTVSCMAAWALNAALPDSWAALRPLLFIAVVACLVQVAEIFNAPRRALAASPAGRFSAADCDELRRLGRDVARRPR